MNYDIDESYNAVVIRLKGNVMGGPESSDFMDEMHALRDDGKTNVVVDVGRVKYMNSSGLGMLVGALTTMRNGGGDVRLANVADRIRSLLIITKLITIFESFDSVEEAIESFSENPPGDNVPEEEVEE